jgi:catechol 2,3-dioxygenase-like lactoylglutathione lyase family enzyme
MLNVGVVALGVTDVARAREFWRAALGYDVREDGFGGWATVLTPPDGCGPKIALQRSQTPAQDHPRMHLDLHVVDAAEQSAETARLLSLGANGSIGTAIRTTRTSSCSQIPTATVSASLI